MHLVQAFAQIFAPVVICTSGAIMLFSRKDISVSFLNGAKEGLQTCFGLLPSLILLIIAVHMFSASGALQLICNSISGLASSVGIPEEIIPVVIMRPISGSGTTAMMQELLAKAHPDSFAGRCASILMGASDTIIYTLAMYFGSVGIKKTRHAFPASFIVLIFCVFLSVKLASVF